MKQKRFNATLTIAVLALTTLLILTTLSLAGTAAPRLEGQQLESLTALNSTEATERGASLSAFSAPSAASVIQSPGTTARASAALRSSPVMFIENMGQFDLGDRFQVHDGDPTIWLVKDVLSTTAPPATICNSTTIWQIGTFEWVVDPGRGRDEFESGAVFYDVYSYDVDTNPDDEINAPNFPGVLDDELRSRSVWTAKEVNIGFNLDCLYNDVVLAYSRYGSENNDILLDGSWITSTIGPGEDIRRLYSIALGTLTPGVHTVTIRYTGGGVDEGHSIDALSLRGSVPAPTTAIWQIGAFDGAVDVCTGRDEFEAGTAFFDIYNYDVDTNPDDEISAPNFPGILDDAPAPYPDSKWAAKEVNIGFNLDCLYNDVVLAYSRYGSENNDILLDGSWITSTIGPGEDIHQLYSIALGTLTPGVHTVTIRYAGGGVDQGHSIDALGLCGPPTPFLDLPFDYGGSVSAFLQALKDSSAGGRVTAWFDHKYPNYSWVDGIWLYNQEKPFNDPDTRTEPQKDIFCYENYCYDGHNGTDFSRPDPDVQKAWPVLSAADGMVKQIEISDSGYGKNVILYHGVDQGNGYFSRYAHLQGISVTVGITVTSHYTLGMAGNSGNGAGFHLHFGVYRDDGDQVWEPSKDKVVDPFGWKIKTVPDPWVEQGGFPSYRLWLHDPAQKKTSAGDEGTVITDTAGNIQATIPPGAFSGQATFELSPGPMAGTSAQLRSSGHSFWLRVLEWLPGGGGLQNATALQSTTQFTLTKPITFTVAYTDTNLLHLDESQLALHRWDEEQETWHPLTTTVDTVQNVVMAQTQDLGEFDLQTSLLCTTDDLEPDDGYQAASRVWPNDWPLARGLDVPQDSDWVSFQAVQGVTYTISTQNLAGGADTVLNLYDGDAVTLLASNDDTGGGPASEIVWTAPYTGTFFIETVSAPSGTTDCSATYELTIVTIPGDVIADCRVDIADIMQVASRWRCKCGDACYHSVYDRDGDCDVDIVDIMLVVKHWGETCP